MRTSPDYGVAPSDPVGIWRNVEERWRTAIVVALGLAGTALVVAVVAVVLTLVR